MQNCTKVGRVDIFYSVRSVMNDLVVTKNNIPVTMEDLSKFVLVGTEKLKAVKAEIAAIQKIGLAKEVYEQKKLEAQEIAEAVQLASVQVGKILNSMPKASGGDRRSENFKKLHDQHFETTKAESVANLGISSRQGVSSVGEVYGVSQYTCQMGQGITILVRPWRGVRKLRIPCGDFSF